ncbi:MAG: XRE family transcriptional regulator [Erysipelotrichia bacterium]|nr:XRE family transcriptional regulator [Erysipelotrichia bacterium]NCC54112.1 XRE family transcriptional regulator [Erysipelotrichia bacterium]
MELRYILKRLNSEENGKPAFSQNELANALGISKGSINKIIKGTLTPDIDKYKKKLQKFLYLEDEDLKSLIEDEDPTNALFDRDKIQERKDFFEDLKKVYYTTRSMKDNHLGIREQLLKGFLNRKGYKQFLDNSQENYLYHNRKGIDNIYPKFYYKKGNIKIGIVSEAVYDLIQIKTVIGITWGLNNVDILIILVDQMTDATYLNLTMRNNLSFDVLFFNYNCDTERLQGCWSISVIDSLRDYADINQTDAFAEFDKVEADVKKRHNEY